MKNTKLFQILALVLSLAVLTVGLCFAASAADEPSVSINARNVSYGDTVKILFAVDDTNAGDNEIEVIYYLEDPIANPAAQGYIGVEYAEGYTDKMGTEDDTSDDVTYPAFFTAGFPAKNIGDKVYARAHIVGTEVYSSVERYSVVEYLLERLYIDGAEGDKKALYEDLLSYGASAQKVIYNDNDDPADDVEKFVDEYCLVGIDGGTLDGTYSQGTYFVGDKITPQADGVAVWNATVYDLSTGVGTTTEVNNGAEYTVQGFTMITAKTEGETPAPAYKPDLTDTEGRETYEDGDALDLFSWNNWLEGGGLGTLEIVDGAPYGEASKVYHFNTPEGTKPEVSFMFDAKAGASTTIIENDFMFTSTGVLLPKFEIRTSGAVAFGFYIGAQNGEVGLLDENQNVIGKLANDGEWFRLRIEIVDAGDGTSNVLFYLNDNRIAEDHTFTASAAPDALVRFRFWTEQAHTGDLYFDNTKFAHIIPPYSPDLSDTEGRFIFSDNTVDGYKSAGKIDYWMPSVSSGAPAIVDGAPYGVDSKVLAFETNSYTGADQLFFKTSAASCNMFVFETDMMFAPDQNSDYEFTLRSGSTAHLVGISANANGTVTIKNGTTAVTSVNTEEWFRLRVEYESVSSGIEVRIYVNEVIVSTSSPSSSSVAPSELYRVIVQANSTADGFAYFDNVKFEQK